MNPLLLLEYLKEWIIKHPSLKCALTGKEEFLRDEQMKEWAGPFWRQLVSSWAGTLCCNGTTQLCHWKKQPHLPSDNCSQHFFSLNYSPKKSLWIYCLKNVYLTSSQYVIHSVTALPCHVTPKHEWKRERGGKTLPQISLFCTLDSNLFWRDSDLLASFVPLHRWN